MKAFVSLGISFALLATPAFAFKFSDDAQKGKDEEAARQAQIAELLSTPCGKQLTGKKIMVVIAEKQANALRTEQSKYGPHFQAINNKLRALGLKTYTQDEIRKQIAQAEIDAYFRNDPDAALAAQKKLGASFILRGLIHSQAGINPVLKINEVTINMSFTLTAAGGKVVSEATAKNDSYSGTDTLGMALTLVKERADDVVAKLYSDYCSQPAVTGKTRTK